MAQKGQENIAETANHTEQGEVFSPALLANNTISEFATREIRDMPHAVLATAVLQGLFKGPVCHILREPA